MKYPPPYNDYVLNMAFNIPVHPTQQGLIFFLWKFKIGKHLQSGIFK